MSAPWAEIWLQEGDGEEDCPAWEHGDVSWAPNAIGTFSQRYVRASEADEVRRQRDRLRDAADKLLGEAYGQAVAENRPYSAAEVMMAEALAECAEEGG